MADTGPSALQRFLNGILPENPTYRQMLGMCPTLAVTSTVRDAAVMAAATTFVLVASNLMISLLRHLLKPHLRILVFTIAIASFVTLVDYTLAAFLYDAWKALGSFIALIIVNCIIISRCEVCAARQGPAIAVADGFGQGAGFLLGLVSIASVREILGSGTWLGFHVLPGLAQGAQHPTWFGLQVPDCLNWPDWSIMVLAPGAFFTLGCLLALVMWWQQRAAARKG